GRGAVLVRGRLRVAVVGGRRAAGGREAPRRARAGVGGAVRLRVEVDGEPLAPGGAVAGRVGVDEGGNARSLSVRLAFVERTKDFDGVRGEAETVVLAEGELADGAVLPFSLRLPGDALPQVATAHARIGWEVRARADRPGPDPTADRPVELLQ